MSVCSKVRAAAHSDKMAAEVLQGHASRSKDAVPHLGNSFDLIVQYYLREAQKKKKIIPAVSPVGKDAATKDATKDTTKDATKAADSDDTKNTPAPVPSSQTEQFNSASASASPASDSVGDESDRTNSSITEELSSSPSTAATSPPSTGPISISQQQQQQQQFMSGAAVPCAPLPNANPTGYFDHTATFYYPSNPGPGNSVALAPGGSVIAPGATGFVQSGGHVTKSQMNAVPLQQTNVVMAYPGINFYNIPWFGRPHEIAPFYHTTMREKRTLLNFKAAGLMSIDAILMHEKTAGSVASRPVHIFVDLSNIIIGFYDQTKAVRGIQPPKRVKAPAFDFVGFDQLLVRNRKVSKRIVAGSLSARVRTWPAYMDEAADVGYEMNIMRRVAKTDLPRSSKDALYDQATTSSPDSSLDDSNIRAVLKEAEQGVDELLHLKMLQSVMDVRDKPATAILATGDAAQAQFSDGFKANVERMLEGGWNVELYGWSNNVSSAWTDPRFLKRWGKSFRMIELDSFAEELYAYHVPEMYF